jgi:RNA polymerase sigma-70 factor (ECF subfamily)
LIDGYSVRETGEILDIPEGTVLSRFSRAQKRLRKLLSPMVKGLL